MKKLLLLTITSVMLMATPAMADSIGFIDMEKVFYSFKDSRKIQEQLQEKRKVYQEKVAKRQEKLVKLREEGKEDQMKKELEQMEAELKPERDELIRFEGEKRRELQERVVRATKTVAKAYGIDVVVDKQVLIIGGFDLTDFVIERMNQN
jgi:Skp family chaperone for outer membrane proteins